MRTLSTLLLVLAHLSGISLGPLKQNLVDGSLQLQSNHQPTSLTQHQPLTTPIRLGTEKLQLGATSILAWDTESARSLYELDPHKQLPIASITKLVSAMVILRSHKLDEVVTVPILPLYAATDARMGLTTGEQFKLGDLLAATLIPSANDAADALAIYDSKTITAFSAKMNRLVAGWGIGAVHFTNPSGLSDQDNYASAEALVKLAKIALKNQDFSKLVSTNHTVITNLAGKTYDLTSTNQLLPDLRIKGIKTGFTAAAGQSFLALAEIKGHSVITVVLNSPDRFTETLQLLNWIERNYTWE